MADIFRKIAYNRIASPDQLDQMVTVAGSQAWLAALMLGLMLVAVVVWSIVGSIPTRIKGEGILIGRGGRVFDALAPSPGYLAQLETNVGDLVTKDQIYAVLARTDTELELQNARARVVEAQFNRDESQRVAADEMRLKRETLARQKSALQQQVEGAEAQARFMRDKLGDDERLLEKKIVTRTDVQRSRSELNQASLEVAEAMKRLASTEAEEMELTSTVEQRLREAGQRVNEEARRVRELEAKLELSTVVRAPASGRVTEVKVAVGSALRQGEPVFSVEASSDGLELLLYLRSEQGKTVEFGMPVQISPSTAKREEFGSMLGVVRGVSHFPTTLDAMRARLQNEDLARTFAQEGPPFEAWVDLDPDPATASGYRWTSERGATLPLTSGTIAAAEVTVRSQAPITLAIPLLREWTGL